MKIRIYTYLNLHKEHYIPYEENDKYHEHLDSKIPIARHTTVILINFSLGHLQIPQ